MSNQQNLPELLYICEQGAWDNALFVPTGLWEAQDDKGTSYHAAAQELGVERWLVNNGYRDLGDGISYIRGDK